MDTQLHLSPAISQSEPTQTIAAVLDRYPTTFLQAARVTPPIYEHGRPTLGEDCAGVVAEAFCEPRAARDVPAGSSWAFLDHRTMAEVMLDDAMSKQARAEEAA